MSRRYTRQTKTRALRRLKHNGGHIALTSVETGIPERTLREWRTQIQRQEIMNHPDDEVENGDLLPPPPKKLSSCRRRYSGDEESENPEVQPQEPLTNEEKLKDASNVYHTLRQLRDDLLNRINNMADEMPYVEDEYVPLHTLALSRLLDRVFKLEEVIFKGDPYEPREYVTRVEFRQPDGSLSEFAPWHDPRAKTIDEALHPWKYPHLRVTAEEKAELQKQSNEEYERSVRELEEALDRIQEEREARFE